MRQVESVIKKVSLGTWINEKLKGTITPDVFEQSSAVSASEHDFQ